jgi:hypothetical protein
MAKKKFIIVLFGTILFSSTARDVNSHPSLQSSNPTYSIYQSGTIILTNQDYSENYPQVAYNSKHNEYLVVWEGGSGASQGIYGQRLTTHGQKVGPNPDTIAVGSKIRKNPAVDYDPINDRYLVVWDHDHDDSYKNFYVSGRYIPWQGSDPAYKEFKISDQPDAQFKPKVEYNSTKEEFLIVWFHMVNYVVKDLMGARLKADGSGFLLKDKNILGSISNLSGDYDLNFNPSRNEYLVVWSKQNPTTIFDLYMTRLRWDGQILGSKDNLLASSKGEEKNPSIAVWETPEGKHGYFIVWDTEHSTGSTSSAKIEGKFIAGNLDAYPGTVIIRDTQFGEYRPVVSAYHQRDQMLVVWSQGSEDSPGLNGIWGRFVNFAEQPGPAFEIAPPTGNQPIVYWKISTVLGGKSNFLVVWEHERSGTSITDIYAKLLYPYVSYLPITMRK